MARDTRPSEDLNSQAKRAVEQTKEQVLGAVDTYFNFLQKTISSFPTGGSDLGEKMKSYAEKNTAATHEFLRKVGQAKDFQEILRIQTEFTQSQMNVFSEQTKSFGESYASARAAATTSLREGRRILRPTA